MLVDPTVTIYKAGAFLARELPGPVVNFAAERGGRLVGRLATERRHIVTKNLRRVNPSLSGRRLEAAVDASFASYARYWAESFRLPSIPISRLDAEFSWEGYEHVVDARAHGHGAIIALPHLGGWEWAAFWLAALEKVPVTAIVEQLSPPELFMWFVQLRESLGMNVVPLGPNAGRESLKALRMSHVLCLLSDRDIEGNGVEVEFFGERTTIPAGPAMLAFRTGAPLLPTAIYFERRGHKAVVKPPLVVERQGKLRDDVQRVSQNLAYALEALIRQAPEQWHLMSPNWPSDVGTVGY